MAAQEFSHTYSYQTADSYCVAIQLRPPYEGGRHGVVGIVGPKYTKMVPVSVCTCAVSRGGGGLVI